MLVAEVVGVMKIVVKADVVKEIEGEAASPSVLLLLVTLPDGVKGGYGAGVV